MRFPWVPPIILGICYLSIKSTWLGIQTPKIWSPNCMELAAYSRTDHLTSAPPRFYIGKGGDIKTNELSIGSCRLPPGSSS